jgi:hypothetical protein
MDADARNRLGRRLVAAERFSRARRAHGVRVRPLRAEKPAWQRVRGAGGRHTNLEWFDKLLG